MPGGIFAGIDWSRPWLAHLAATAAPLLDAADWRAALDREAAMRRLHNHRGLPVGFVPQSSLPLDMAYETFISETGSVPTRDNLHDFFNALIWLTFPQVKAQLNALQAGEIERIRTGAPAPAAKSAVRGRVRDAATIFDENAAVLVTSDAELIHALRAHRWTDVFLKRRQAFERDCDVILFGHALIEKLVSPYKSITAHARWLHADPAYFSLSAAERFAWCDTTLAAELKCGLSAAEFTPIPILGVPGWWDGQTVAFYEDRAVFRPPKKVVTG